MELMTLRRTLNLEHTTPFDLSRANMNSENVMLRRASKDFWAAMTMRKQAIFSNKDKIDAVLKIITTFEGRKWLIVFKSIKMATECSKLIPGSAVYHSKQSAKLREQVLQRVRDGKTNILIGVDALNEGLDIPALDAGISASGDSSGLVFTQTLGRTIRKVEGKTALFFNLYSLNREEK